MRKQISFGPSIKIIMFCISKYLISAWVSLWLILLFLMKVRQLHAFADLSQLKLRLYVCCSWWPGLLKRSPNLEYLVIDFDVRRIFIYAIQHQLAALNDCRFVRSFKSMSERQYLWLWFRSGRHRAWMESARFCDLLFVVTPQYYLYKNGFISTYSHFSTHIFHTTLWSTISLVTTLVFDPIILQFLPFMSCV